MKYRTIDPCEEKKYIVKSTSSGQEKKYADTKQHRSLTIWTPGKCLDFRGDPGRQESEVKTNPQPIKESGILRRKDKPKTAVRNNVKGTLDTYAK